MLERARAAGVHGMIIAGIDPVGWARQQAMTTSMAWHCYGLHPWAVADMSEEAVTAAITTLRQTLATGQPVGLGETGLDHGRRICADSRPRQQRAFEAQLALAKEHDLPVVLHIVRAHDDAIRTLQRCGLPSRGGMVHSFSGHRRHAQAMVELGLHISFSGGITRDTAHHVRRAAATVPLDRLLVETDAPDQPPKKRRPGPNEPAFLIDVIEAVADTRNEAPQAIAEATAHNARRLFHLPTTPPVP